MMEDVCGGGKPFLSSNLLETEHLRVKDKAMEHFTGRRKMGGSEFSEKYKERLEQVKQQCLAQCFMVIAVLHNSIWDYAGNRRAV